VFLRPAKHTLKIAKDGDEACITGDKDWRSIHYRYPVHKQDLLSLLGYLAYEAFTGVIAYFTGIIDTSEAPELSNNSSNIRKKLESFLSTSVRDQEKAFDEEKPIANNLMALSL
jgi:hypothetical protein